MKKIDHYDFTWTQLIKSLLFLFGEYKIKYLCFLAIVFFSLFYSVIPPLVIGKIVDFFTHYHAGDSLTTFYSYSIFLGASFALIAYIRLTTKKKLGDLRTNIIYNIRVTGFENLLSLSWLDTRKEIAGAKSQKIENGTRAITSLLEQINNDIFQSITTLIGISIIFFTIESKYLLAIFVYILGFFGIIKYYYRRIVAVQDAYNQATEKTGGTYIEGLSNILTIKTLGATKSFQSHVQKAEEIRKHFEFIGRKYGIGQWITFQVFNGLSITAFLLMMGHDLITGLISLGYIVTFYTYVDKLTGSAGNILWEYENIISNKSAIGRMMPIFTSNKEQHAGKVKFPSNWQSLSLTKASYDYQTKNASALHNISFTIKRGQKIGIVGHTGSGKSTIAKILVGLLPLSKGSYQVDQHNFADLSHDSVINKIGLVLQETEIFNLSFKENITMLKSVKPELFYQAIQITQLEDVVAKLPDGLDTLLGEKGYNLSGGERQRIGLARIICRNPDIIIMDEATSSVDSKTEQKIQEGIEIGLKNKTVIAIAHRVATLKNVDHIFVFEKGGLVEEGDYHSLSIDPNSRFSHYYHEQVKSKT